MADYEICVNNNVCYQNSIAIGWELCPN